MIDFAIYLITDGDLPTLPARVEAALAAMPVGCAAVQLRAKAAAGRELLELATVLRRITRARGSRLFVNDRVDVALAAGADGVQLPELGFPVERVRAMAPGLLVGASRHDLDGASQAARQGAHFVTLGPVWATPSKPGFEPTMGIERLAAAARALAVPVFALGGVDDVARVVACRSVGARVACLRAVLGARSPSEEARAFAEAMGFVDVTGAG